MKFAMSSIVLLGVGITVNHSSATLQAKWLKGPHAENGLHIDPLSKLMKPLMEHMLLQKSQHFICKAREPFFATYARNLLGS